MATKRDVEGQIADRREAGGRGREGVPNRGEDVEPQEYDAVVG